MMYATKKEPKNLAELNDLKSEIKQVGLLEN